MAARLAVPLPAGSLLGDRVVVHGDHDRGLRPRHPCQLPHRGPPRRRVREVLERVRAEDAIEGAVHEGKTGQVAADEVEAVRFRCPAPELPERIEGEIERHRVNVAPVILADGETGAAAGIQDPLSRTAPQVPCRGADRGHVLRVPGALLLVGRGLLVPLLRLDPPELVGERLGDEHDRDSVDHRVCVPAPFAAEFAGSGNDRAAARACGAAEDLGETRRKRRGPPGWGTWIHGTGADRTTRVTGAPELGPSRCSSKEPGALG